MSKGSLPHGYLAESVRLALRACYEDRGRSNSVQFTVNQLIDDHMPAEGRDKLIQAYGGHKGAAKAVGNALSNMAYKEQGVIAISRRHAGRSVWQLDYYQSFLYKDDIGRHRYESPTIELVADNGPHVGDQRTFVIAGVTGDGGVLWREDGSDRIGFLTFEEL